MSLVAYGESSGSEEEDSVPSEQYSSANNKSQDIRKLLSVLPGPAKKGKYHVKIGLPKLEKRGDSDDSDDDIPSAKRPQARGGGSGLTALLPQPRQATKSLDVPKPALNTRTMTPYTLTKRYQDSKKKTPMSKAAALKLKKAKLSGSKKTEAGESDSDDDGETISFFSHLDESRTKPAPEINNTNIASLSQVQSQSNSESNSRIESGSISSMSVQSAPVAPKPFKLNATSEDTPTYTYYDPSVGYQTYGEPSSYQLTDTPIPQEWDPTHQCNNEAESSGNGGVVPETTPSGPMPGPGPGLSISQDVFRRLAGGKKRKNREESLNDIIDIQEADVKEGIELYRRHNSDETVNQLYQQSAGKAPTGQQKRKHQLSYLAHQAKANELQLMKQWGQAAATKKQTQMKYGF